MPHFGFYSTLILMSDPRQFKNSLINPTQAALLIKGLGLRVSIQMDDQA